MDFEKIRQWVGDNQNILGVVVVVAFALFAAKVAYGQGIIDEVPGEDGGCFYTIDHPLGPQQFADAVDFIDSYVEGFRDAEGYLRFVFETPDGNTIHYRMEERSRICPVEKSVLQ